MIGGDDSKDHAAPSGALPSTRGAQSPANRDARRNATVSLCSFWLGECCLGIDTRLVGEVVTVEEYIQVPLAPTAVRGIFNLRGEPVPLVSLATMLKLAVPEPTPSRALTAIVLRGRDVVVGLIADRMETVLAVSRGQLSPLANAQEDADYLGFLQLTTDSVQTVVSVLDPEAIFGHLALLKFNKVADG